MSYQSLNPYDTMLSRTRRLQIPAYATTGLEYAKPFCWHMASALPSAALGWDAASAAEEGPARLSRSGKETYAKSQPNSLLLLARENVRFL